MESTAGLLRNLPVHQVDSCEFRVSGSPEDSQGSGRSKPLDLNGALESSQRKVDSCMQRYIFFSTPSYLRLRTEGLGFRTKQQIICELRTPQTGCSALQKKRCARCVEPFQCTRSTAAHTDRPGVELRANLKSISHRCHPILVAFA